MSRDGDGAFALIRRRLTLWATAWPRYVVDKHSPLSAHVPQYEDERLSGSKTKRFLILGLGGYEFSTSNLRSNQSDTKHCITLLKLSCLSFQSILNVCKLIYFWVDHKRTIGHMFWWGNLRERDHLGDQDVDGRIILRWIFRKWEGVVGTGWSWLRIGTVGGRLWVR